MIRWLYLDTPAVLLSMIFKYKITAVMKVEIDVTTSIVIPVIMYNKTFKIDIVAFIGNII